MTTHGALTEPSVSPHVATHDRKGREGKGVRKGMTGVARIHRRLSYPTHASMDELHRRGGLG